MMTITPSDIFREELLNLSITPSVRLATKHLDRELKNQPGIKRREIIQFDGQVHLEAGLGIFSTADYVRSYNLAEADFE